MREHDLAARGARAAPRSRAASPDTGCPPSCRSLYQPDGGFVLPERCIVAHVAGALARGAESCDARERVLEWAARENGVRVTTDRGVVEAERLVLTRARGRRTSRGSRAGSVVAERQVLAWFQPSRPELFDAGALSRSSTSRSDGEHFYGFPAYGIPGFKLGRYDHDGEAATRTRSTASRRPRTRSRCARSPSATSRTAPARRSRCKTCLFEPSPDEHFLIDRHPETELAVVGAGFSGHGFKFCSVVGEILADLALDGRDAPRHRLPALRRFE